MASVVRPACKSSAAAILGFSCTALHNELCVRAASPLKVCSSLAWWQRQRPLARKSDLASVSGAFIYYFAKREASSEIYFWGNT
jgi:hypothetical protein